MMSRLAATAAVLVLGGCAAKLTSTGEPGVFNLSKTSAACGGGDAQAILRELRTEAAQYCTLYREGSPSEVLTHVIDGIPFVRCASASFSFRCVK